jgi:ATP-dependent DNA ligase
MGCEMQLSDRIGRRMKLQDLNVLMAVVQAGGMSKAAGLLNTTQSAISRSIAELEHTIGVRLLGAEGIVSKRLGSPYRSGPCHAWVKCKNPAAVAVQRERSGNWNK